MKRAAVIGGGFGGLVAAAELARAGHAVTLFELSNTLGGKAQVVTHTGVTLDTGPTLLTMPATVRAVFERIGASDLLPNFHRLPLQARYSWSKGPTFDCHEDLERSVTSAAQFGAREGEGLRDFYADAARTFRAAGEPYLEAPFENMPDFLARVMKRGPKAMYDGMQLATLDVLARRHFRSPQLQQFVNRFATYAGASPYEASAAFALIPHLERAQGVHHVEGGMGALVKALGAALSRLDVKVVYGQRAQWQARKAELLAGPRGGEQPFDTVVVNADPFQTEPLGARPLAMSGYVVLLDVARRLDLAHHHIVFGDDYVNEFAELFDRRVPPSDPTLYFCHPAATDASMAPAGRSGVFAMVNAPALPSESEAARWPEYAQRLQARCVDALLSTCPGLSRDEVKVLGERTPLDLAQRGAPGGSIYGFLPHGKFGPFNRPKIRSETPGVFFSGGSTHPGGGVPLCMLSGHFAAELALRHLGGRA